MVGIVLLGIFVLLLAFGAPIATPCNDLMLQLVLAKQSIYLGR